MFRLPERFEHRVGPGLRLVMRFDRSGRIVWISLKRTDRTVIATASFRIQRYFIYDVWSSGIIRDLLSIRRRKIRGLPPPRRSHSFEVMFEGDYVAFVDAGGYAFVLTDGEVRGIIEEWVKDRNTVRRQHRAGGA